MQEENLFNVEDQSDLPDEIKEKINYVRLHRKTLCLYNLFKCEKSLSRSELIVGLYRKYGLTVSTNWLVTALYRLKNRNLIVEVDKKQKIYQLNN